MTLPQFVPYWGRDEIDAVARVLSESDYLNEHETVREFEREFAKFVGARHCAAVTSGTAAIYCASCVAFPGGGGGGGDPEPGGSQAGSRGPRTKAPDRGRVLVPSHDGIFAFNAARASGARPVVCDVDGRGLLLEPAGHGGPDAQSVMVHANGRVSGGVRAVEDCAQAIGHHTRGKISTYSFASTKHITTGGQGGAVCCDDDETFDRIVRIKDHGRNDRQSLRPMSDNYDEWGVNFKLTEMQAAFGLAQLRMLPGRLRRLGEMYHMYRDLLGGAVGFDEDEPRWYVDVFTPHAARIRDDLRAAGIHCRAYPKPLHLQGVAAAHAYASFDGAFANAERRHRTGLYLPSTTNMTDDDVHLVSEAVKKSVARGD